MRNIAPQKKPRYENFIQGRPDYDDCAYAGETKAEVDARTRYVDKLFDAPPKLKFYLLRGIDRRGKVPLVAELIEFVTT